MTRQASHGAFPEINHDEMARQDFALRLREYVAGDIVGGNDAVYRHAVEPDFVRAHGRKPETRKEVRQAMERHPFHQAWGALNRATQEIIWDSVQDSLDRQDDALNRRIKNANAGKGSLRLNPAVKAPRYLAAVDIHCMPGNYHTEYTADDAYQGALLDRGAFIYARGARGPNHDSFGHDLLAYLKKTRPDFQPRRILDMGAGAGQVTCAIATAFPQAEVHAIDVAAPLLRYGHKRASSLGHAIHFSQQNAEATDFADESFDLIVSCIMMHETSSKALRNYVKETHRLLAPGGISLHMDFPHNENKSPYAQAMVDWSTHYNAEPFIGTLGDTDWADVAVQVGFSHNTATVVPMSTVAPTNHMYVLDARKPA
ncbi:MAG: class I SAM-dependent methyltransferase [Alphaproteobacteria bacterium]